MAWIDSPQYNPRLARERLDDYVVELEFRANWASPTTDPLKFFEVTVTHPHHTGGAWRFTTYAQARERLHDVLEECHRRAEEEVTEGPPSEL
jgi:hypothetical protein